MMNPLAQEITVEQESSVVLKIRVPNRRDTFKRAIDAAEGIYGMRNLGWRINGKNHRAIASGESYELPLEVSIETNAYRLTMDALTLLCVVGFVIESVYLLYRVLG